MNKQLFVVLGISLGLTFLTSTIFGLAGSAIIGTFWAWFWISMSIIFVVFAISNSYFIQKDVQVLQRQELEALDKLSNFSVRLTCSYCQQPNAIPIQLNQRNTFKCESCNQVNGVSMQFTATTLTTPIESVKMPVENSGSVEFKVM